jgi:hypothetical protein
MLSLYKRGALAKVAGVAPEGTGSVRSTARDALIGYPHGVPRRRGERSACGGVGQGLGRSRGARGSRFSTTYGPSTRQESSERWKSSRTMWSDASVGSASEDLAPWVKLGSNVFRARTITECGRGCPDWRPRRPRADRGDAFGSLGEDAGGCSRTPGVHVFLAFRAAFVIRDSGTIVSKTRDGVDRPRQASRRAGGQQTAYDLRRTLGTWVRSLPLGRRTGR